MKVSICDVCVQENKIGYGMYRLRLKGSRMSLGLDLCKKHKEYGKGRTVDETIKAYVKLENTPKPLWRIDLCFEKNLK